MNLHDDQSAFAAVVVTNDELLATGIPATAIVKHALTSQVIAESDRVVIRFEGDQVRAVNRYGAPRS